MSPPARQKRTAEASSRFANNKKPRFDYRNPSTLAPDAPEEDSILDLDEVGRSGLRTKRNAVNLDGFDSDSSTEDMATTKNTRTNGAASKDEEEVDMFADADDTLPGGAGRDGDLDEDVGREGKRNGKQVRFIEMDEIEGQELRSTGGGHVGSTLLLNGEGTKGKAAAQVTLDGGDGAESSSESGDDSERARLDADAEGDEDAAEIGAGGKKRHAPKLDAFNMRAEGDEGRFDESGNFVRKAVDPDAVHDTWLEGVSKRDVKRAAEAQALRDEERRRKTAEDDALLTSDLLATLIRHLERGETPLEALQRLGCARKKVKAKKVPKWKQKKINGTKQAAGEEMDVEEQQEQQTEDPAETRRRETVEAITGAADGLFSRDQQEIYDQERELLMRQYARETGVEWKDVETDADGANGATADSRQWEYRWADGRDGGAVNGPYDEPTIKAWIDAGYFGDGVEYRQAGASEWRASPMFA